MNELNNVKVYIDFCLEEVRKEIKGIKDRLELLTGNDWATAQTYTFSLRRYEGEKQGLKTALTEIKRNINSTKVV